MQIKGHIFKYGDDINTDVIFPGRYTYVSMSSEELATHALEDLDPLFSKEVRKGDVIVAGKNFGMGSSREQAATSLVACGIGAIIAKSFSRIFFRNAINNGLLVIIQKDVYDIAEKNDLVEIDTENGIIKVNGKVFPFSPYPAHLMDIIEAGGLLNLVKRKLHEGS